MSDQKKSPFHGHSLTNPKASASSFQQLDKLSEIVSIVVEGASTDEVAVDHAGFVDEGSSANLQVELAVGRGGHAPPHDTICPGGDFHPVADAANRQVVVEKNWVMGTRSGSYRMYSGARPFGKKTGR